VRLLLVVLLCGCGSAGTGSIALSWQFADQRRCPDTGAATVEVKVSGAPPLEFDCADGVAPAAVTLDQVSLDGANITVRALSVEEAPLYTGGLELDALPSSATVTLYAGAMH
jgi:hypothetical protein